MQFLIHVDNKVSKGVPGVNNIQIIIVIISDDSLLSSYAMQSTPDKPGLK